MFQKIIVCSDGSDNALYATRAGVAIAKRFGSAAQLLDVINPMYMDTEGLGVWSLMTDQNSISATAELQHQAIKAQAAPMFEAAGVPFTAIQELGHPVGTIVEYAERAQSDLIVIGSRGLNELKSFVMGSVSSGVLHYAPCPVLVTHGEGMSPEAGWFQNILLASDGSPSAHQAALAARALAQKFGSALTVVNVSEKHKMLSEVADAYGELYPSEVTARVRAALLENVVAAARQEGIRLHAASGRRPRRRTDFVRCRSHQSRPDRHGQSWIGRISIAPIGQRFNPRRAPCFLPGSHHALNRGCCGERVCLNRRTYVHTGEKSGSEGLQKARRG